ncbi:MAG TPA: hypothetical protein DDX91_06075 [Ruminococcaceae bacterium]|nr:hypothetical protein [Oscillospiraceae bacterium]
MDKKKTVGIVSLCVLGVAAAVFLYLIGFFNGGDITGQPADNSPVITIIENSIHINSGEVTERDTRTEEFEESRKTETGQDTKPVVTLDYKFRSKNLLMQHYEKHGKNMGFPSAEEYEKAASAVVNNPDALHKTEAEDGDDVYYVKATNEFVVISTDGYIRTYFLPDKGIDYFNKQ